MRRRYCRRRGGGGWFFVALFGAAAVISNAAANVHITAPAVWVQLLIGVGVTVALLGVGYLYIWKG